ncbi:ankyrin repeat domain-containing protein 50 [Microdochium nivale]|nr:ankyrin repeat domain-containing protein 50 [Microdochium nivale]
MAAVPSNIFNTAGSINASGEARVQVGDSHHHHVHNHDEDPEAKRKRLRFKFLQRLRACPYEERKNRNIERASGTCEWFTEHKLFRSWQAQASALLWISADPGCGKSVLSRYLIDDVLQLGDAGTICYFFFKDDFDDQRSLVVALCCILHQLFTQEAHTLSDSILRRVEETGDYLFGSVKELLDLLLDAASHCNTGVLCILDALDECSDFKPLAEFLAKYFTQGKTASKLKFIITSRPYEYISRGLAIVPTIRLRGENEEEANEISREVNTVIQQQVRQLVNLRGLTDAQEQSLWGALNSTRQSSHLWVHLIFESLKEVNALSQSTFSEAIRTLPRSIEEAYDKILSKSRDTKNVLKVLQLVVAATRPLQLEEVATALTFDSEKHHTYADLVADLSDATALGKEIRDLCGFFIKVTNGRVYLLHQTAREFLVGAAPRVHTQLKWQTSIDIDAANTVLAGICMRFLILLHPNMPAELGWGLSGNVCDSHPFLGYAATYWPEHFQQCNTKAIEALNSVAHELCSERTWWLDIYESSQQVRLYGRSPIDVAAKFGLHTLISSFLQLPRSRKFALGLTDRLSSRNRLHLTALEIATQEGHVEFVEIMLKSAAFSPAIWSLPIPNPFWATRIRHIKDRALTYAVKRGDHRIAKLLLEAGASPNYQEEDDIIPILTKAARHGDDEMVKMLIQYGGKHGVHPQYVLQEGPTTLNPVMKAALVGDCTQLQHLLNHGLHNIDAVDAAGDTALVRAAAKHHWNAVELLLRHNAAVDAVDFSNNTALLYAVIAANERIIRLLLERGADASLFSSYLSRKSILSIVVEFGRTDILKLLLVHSSKTNRFLKCRDALFWGVKSVETLELFLKSGTSLDMETPMGNSAVSHFALLGKQDIVQALVKHGTRIAGPNDIPPPIKADIRECPHAGFGRASVAAAASKGHLEIMRLLVKCGAQIDACHSNGLAPIFWAARNGHKTAVEFLLHHDERSGSLDTDGRTLLFQPFLSPFLPSHCERHDHKWSNISPTNLLDFLLNYGVQIEAADYTGHTALHIAAYHGHEFVMERATHFLLDRGASIEARTLTGKTPLMMAASNNNHRVIALLLARGADVEAADYDGHTALWWAYECSRVVDGLAMTFRMLRRAGASESNVKHRLRRWGNVVLRQW